MYIITYIDVQNMNKQDVFFSDLLRYFEWISLDVAGELRHRTRFPPVLRVETCDEVPHNSSTPSPQNLEIWVGQLTGKEVYHAFGAKKVQGNGWEKMNHEMTRGTNCGMGHNLEGRCS